MFGDELDPPEFTQDQLDKILERVGMEARRIAFEGNRPIYVLRHGKVVAIYRDGHEEIMPPRYPANGGIPS